MGTQEKIEDIYHVFSDGMRTASLFLDDAAFAAGMNAVGLCKLKCNVEVLCFCLMDNHVHFILSGTRFDCSNFIRRYRTWYAKWRGGLDEEMRIGIKNIDTKDYLLTAIAYVLRNPIAAGYPYLPVDYMWSSANLYFRAERSISPFSNIISEFRTTKIREMLSTRQCVPSHWTADVNGMIWPGHYVSYKKVNRLFGHLKRYMYYLSATQEAEVSESLGVADMAVLPEKELRKNAIEFCKAMFSKDRLSVLSVSDRLVLSKRLRKEFGCSYKQIARIVHLDVKYLDGLL